MSVGEAGLSLGIPGDTPAELKALITMTSYDGNQDSVADSARDLFKNYIQSQPNVHGTFFASTQADGNTSEITNESGFDFEGFAAGYVSAAIARVSSFGFGDCINESKCLDFMKTKMASDSWKKLGLELYSILFPQKVTYGGYNFQHFMDSNRAQWGEKLFDAVTTDPFLNTHVSAIIHNEWPDMQRQVNIMFFKLHLLGDQSLVDRCVAKWREALEDKVTVDWDTYDYLNGSKSMNIEEIKNNIQSVVNQEHTEELPILPNPMGPTMPTFRNTYGAQVASFISDWSSKIGVTTGKKPGNVKYNTPSPFGCFLPGTKVLLSDGQPINIEEVHEGMKILSHGGTFSTQTGEEVRPLIPAGEKIYSFNEKEPFFSSGHALWTTEGWKAVSPHLAREENPNLIVGALQVGDIVFRVAQLSPLLYEPVTIHRLNSRLLESHTKMHGLHLTGGRSYHADGYVVIMNYPSLTQQRLSSGLAKLSHEEKQKLTSAIASVEPELTKVVGGFLPATLRNAGLVPGLQKHDTN